MCDLLTAFYCQLPRWQRTHTWTENLSPYGGQNKKELKPFLIYQVLPLLHITLWRRHGDTWRNWIQLHSFLSSAMSINRQLHTPSALYPVNPRHILNSRLDTASTNTWNRREISCPVPGIEPWFLCCPVRILVTKVTELSRLSFTWRLCEIYRVAVAWQPTFNTLPLVSSNVSAIPHISASGILYTIIFCYEASIKPAEIPSIDLNYTECSHWLRRPMKSASFAHVYKLGRITTCTNIHCHPQALWTYFGKGQHSSV